MSFLKRNLVPLIALAMGSLVLAAAVVLVLLPPPGRPGVITSGVAAIGGPFRLTSQTGAPVTEADLKGKPFAVFFGFTHCPDVCPTALFDISSLLKDLGPAGDRMQVLFVSVDPARDTPELLRTYLESFDPRITALTGTEEEVQAMAKAYRAFYRKVPTGGGNYTVEHTATVYLMGRSGEFVTALDAHENREAKLAKLKRLVAAS